ncbi:MAG: hypothetical protein K2L13_02680 [Opitutales bacterium]|nr:hypothetical protein [Opitutales bacterium]
MSIIQKAIQRNKQRPTKDAHDGPMIDKKLISGCYGIDNLFVDKSKKLSFAEFWAGLKDIFLGCLIFIPKVLSLAFSIIKRPGYALGIFCTLLLAFIITLTRGAPKHAQNVTAIRNARFVVLADEPKSVAERTNAVDENFTKNDIKKDSIDGAKSVASVVVKPSLAVQDKVKGLHFSRAFESKVNNFFAQHKISDIMCKNGRCLLKIDNNVFCERSTLCEFPKIVMESSTDDELIFSDGMGNYCAIKIDDLFQ